MPRPVSKQSKRTLVPRSVLFGNPEKSSPKISPDGLLLGYLAPDSAGILNVFVRNLDGTEEFQVTRDSHRGIRFFEWQLDSRALLYIQDKDGDENWHLFQSFLQDGTTRDLTPFPDIHTQIVAGTPEFPDQVVVALNKRDVHCHDAYRLDLETGQLELAATNPGDVTSWTADYRLRVRAASALSPGGDSMLRFRESEEADWREVLRWGPEEAFGGILGFTQDNARLLVTTSVDANTARLLEVDPRDGDIRVLAEDPRFDVAETILHPSKHYPQAVRFVRERAEFKVLDAKVGPVFDLFEETLDGDLSIASRDLSGNHWVIGEVMDDAPPRYWHYDAAGDGLQFLFSTRTELNRFRLAPMKPFSFRAADGMRLYGYLSFLAEQEPADLPMVLLVHGGPWVRDTWGFSSEVQWLANRGYVVLQVNFRGSAGFGKEYLNAGNREWGSAMLDDLLAGRDWALEQGYGDPDRVGIFGGSYGGYAVLSALAFRPEEFACGVDVVGPSSLLTLIRSIPPYWTPMKSIFTRRVGDVEQDEEFLKSRSPLFKADQIRRPLLIAQGANDPRVKRAESDQIVASMRERGQDVTYLVFPDEGHGFARPENRKKFYAAAERFLADHLGGWSQPPSPAEEWRDLME